MNEYLEKAWDNKARAEVWANVPTSAETDVWHTAPAIPKCLRCGEDDLISHDCLYPATAELVADINKKKGAMEWFRKDLESKGFTGFRII